MKLFYLFFGFILFSATAFARYATPGTFVKWNLDSLVLYSGGTVTLSNGSYNVNDTLFISQNDTLSITSNATVKFNTGTYMDVNGTILINPPTSVMFTAQNAANGFVGMRLDSSNSSVLRKLTFEYAIALRIADCSPIIDSCIFRYNNNSTSTTFGTSAITLFRSKTAITNSKFLDNQRAAISGGSNIANAPRITGCLFMGNNTQNANVPQINLGTTGTDTVRIINNQILRASTNSGGIGFLPIGNVYAIITGNLIKNNRYGLTFNGGSNITALVSYNQVDSNNTQNDPNLGGSGIAFSGGSGTSHQNVIVTGNLFRWNLWGITIGATTTGGGAKPNLGNITNTDTTDDGKNIFAGNTNTSTPNIDLYNNNVDSIFAQNNYWDVQEGSSVELHIFHKPDNAALGFVNYLPLLLSLPVKLSQFSGAANKLNTVLHWQTLTETNSDSFVIEKSLDGITFHHIEKIKAAGNTSAVHNYQFTDPNAFAQSDFLYYRLQMVDKDAKFTYSQVVSVKRNGSLTESVIKVYPTLLSGSQQLQAQIISSKNQTVRIYLYNAAGSLLFSTSKAIVAGRNVFTVRLDKALPNGQLFAQFTGDDFMEQVAIVKQ